MEPKAQKQFNGRFPITIIRTVPATVTMTSKPKKGRS
jgi:hypothetical protein